MKRIIILTLLLLGTVTASLCAEEVTNNLSSDAFGIYVSFDVDPMFATGIGVAKSIPLDFMERDLLLSADISLPIFLLDLKHYELNIAGRIRLFDIGIISIVNRLGLFLMGTDNDIYAGTTFGIKESILIGYFGDGWFVAAEAEYDKSLMAYIAHSDLYKDNVYADAVDGWYISPAGRFKLGIQGGLTLFQGLSLNARAGYTITERFNDYTVPFYINFCTMYQF